MKSTGWWTVAALLVMTLVRGAALQAQSTKVELSGAVRDPAALPVPGAEVKLVNANTQAEQAYVTDADGAYHFFALQPGTYAVTVAKSGFTTLRRDGVVLRVGDRVSL